MMKHFAAALPHPPARRILPALVLACASVLPAQVAAETPAPLFSADAATAISPLNVQRADVTVTVQAAAVTYVEGSNQFDAVNISFVADPPPSAGIHIQISSAAGSAVAGTHYNGGIFTILVPPNSANVQLPFTVHNNELVGTDKDFSITVSKPAGNTDSYVIGSPATTTVTIQDDDRDSAGIAFGADAGATEHVLQNASEADGTVTFLVSISHAPESDAVFTFEATAAGSASAPADYALMSDTVVFPANASEAQRTQPLVITLQDDADIEGNETLQLRIAAANAASANLARYYTRNNTATLTIADNDGLSAPVFAAVGGDTGGGTPGIAYRFAAAIEGATSYSASYKKLSPGAPDAAFTAATAAPAAAGADNVAFSVRGLDAASVYELRVSAFAGNDEGAAASAVARTPSAACVSAAISPCPPSPPRNLRLTPGETGISAVWEAPEYAGDGSLGDFSAAPQITGYALSSQAAGGAEVEVTRGDAAALRENIGGLEPLEQTIRVRARNDARGAVTVSGEAADAVATPLAAALQFNTSNTARADNHTGGSIIEAASGGVPPLRYALSGLPSGITWQPENDDPRPRIQFSRAPSGENPGVGAYTVTVTVTDSAQPPTTADFPFVFEITDGTPPVIVPRGGGAGLSLLNADYVDSGAVCTDNFDDDKDADASGGVTKGTAGEYSITYTCSDVAGNPALPVVRTVTVRAFSRDVNNDSAIGTADAILVARYFLGARGGGLAAGQSDVPGADIAAFIAAGSWEVDGNSDSGNEYWDGILLVRYQLGMRGAALIAGHPDAATLDADALKTAIETLLAQ